MVGGNMESIRALRQERLEAQEGGYEEEEGRDVGGNNKRGGKLKGKEKYLAHRERVVLKKEKVVKERFVLLDTRHRVTRLYLYIVGYHWTRLYVIGEGAISLQRWV